jgi:hypothetical protein
MRVVFQSLPVPAVEHAPDGRRTPGKACAIATVYEPGEKSASPAALPVSVWLAQGKLTADGGLPNSPPPTIVGPATVQIPAAVLRDLPPDLLLEIGWQINYGE